MAGTSEVGDGELSFHKALGSLNYCIKISNGVALQNQKTSMKIKLEKSTSFQDYEEPAEVMNASLENYEIVIKCEGDGTCKVQDLENEESLDSGELIEVAPTPSGEEAKELVDINSQKGSK